MIDAGRLPAHRVGNVWAIDEADLASHRPALGRPMSPRVARGFVLLAADEPAELSQPEVSRLRSKARLLIDEARSGVLAADVLRSWLPHRAARVAYELPADDLDRLRSDPRIALSGLSHPASRMQSMNIVEGYVLRSDLDRVRAEDFMAASGRSASPPNVILHVADAPLPISGLLIAADLADHRGPREDAQVPDIVLAWAADPSSLVRPEVKR